MGLLWSLSVALDCGRKNTKESLGYLVFRFLRKYMMAIAMTIPLPIPISQVPTSLISVKMPNAKPVIIMAIPKMKIPSIAHLQEGNHDYYKASPDGVNIYGKMEYN